MMTEYAKISLDQRLEGLYAVINASGDITEKLLVPSKYPAPGWRLTKALRFAFDSGWQIAEGSLNWYMHEGMETRSLSRAVPEPEQVPESKYGSLAAEDFRPGYRYWDVREGYENNWTIASVTLAESDYQVYRDGELITPVIVTHTRRDGTVQHMVLGEQVAIQGPWKTEK